MHVIYIYNIWFNKVGVSDCLEIAQRELAINNLRLHDLEIVARIGDRQYALRNFEISQIAIVRLTRKI